jgi:hypothetical protein
MKRINLQKNGKNGAVVEEICQSEAFKEPARTCDRGGSMEQRNI